MDTATEQSSDGAEMVPFVNDFLPRWITQSEKNPLYFEIDADAAYTLAVPQVRRAIVRVAGDDETHELHELAQKIIGDPEFLDQFILECAHQFIKWIFTASLVAAGCERAGWALISRIRAKGEAVKAKWGVKHHQPGRHSELRDKNELAHARKIVDEARELFHELHGMLPT